MSQGEVRVDVPSVSVPAPRTSPRGTEGQAQVGAKAGLLARKETAFVLWRLASQPALVIGELVPGAPIRLDGVQRFPLRKAPELDDLWEVAASACGLVAGHIYHYWFEVDAGDGRRRVTDPTATSVDWRVIDRDSGAPASVVEFRDGTLQAADPGCPAGDFDGEPPLSTLPSNNQLVIYELPTAWTTIGNVAGRDIGVGTFADVTALVDAATEFANFDGVDFAHLGDHYLVDLGVNAVELLPPADSIYNREWGYGTTNCFAPDFELGFPRTYSFPAPNRDLVTLVSTLHAKGMRFLVDVVMGFAKASPCLATSADDFFLLDPEHHHDDPDSKDSRGGYRAEWGGNLWRYAHAVANAFDPVSGQRGSVFPARQLLKAAMQRWMRDFHVDGFRLDSVETVANWDFVEEFKDLARELNRQRFAAQNAADQADARFIVVGEELSEPMGLLRQTVGGQEHRRLDGLWHENFKRYIRYALQGQNHPDEPSFEWTVRKAIDCGNFGYQDLAQAVIYLGSHDVEGMRNERLVNFFWNNGILDAERRAKLAFACLLTAAGIPMIFAGDEFLDQHDLVDGQGFVSQGGGKQVDPVNFSRLSDDWRRRVRDVVARLIALRTKSPALASKDVEFIHVDFNDGKRLLVWRRGASGAGDQVVVVANFSDYISPGGVSGEYVVPGWPSAPAGKQWREITADRAAPQAGREPIFAWEAKVYALV